MRALGASDPSEPGRASRPTPEAEPCPLGISRWRLGADAATPPANRQGEAACQEAVSVCSWLCRQLTREVYLGHSDVRGGAATSPALVRSPAPAQPRTPAHFSLALLVFACVFVSLVVRVGLAGVPAVMPAAPGTPVFASPGVGSVVFVCASLALAFSPAPALPRTSAHLSLALLVFACVFVSLAVRVGLAGVPVVSWCSSGTPIFASPGVGSVVFVCASLALCLL